MKSSLLLAAVTLLLGSCAQREEPGEVAAAQGEREAALRANEANAASDAAEMEAADDAREQAVWSTMGEEGDRMVAFGPPDGNPLFTVQCDATKREIVFSRAVLVGAGQVDMKVGTGPQIKVFQAATQSDPVPQVSGRLSATDPVVQAIAASSEPMSVQVGDGDTLMVPSGGPFQQLIAKCV